MRTPRLLRTAPRIERLPVFAAILLVASSAAAQTASPEDVAAARALGTEGTRLADSGDCNGAIPKLDAAERLYHAPTTLDRLGECQVSVGKLVAGTENLNKVVREPLAPNAPAAFLAAQKRAQQALTAASPRIGNLKIHVDGPSADKLTLTVDGVAVSSALLDADRPTDPGSHEISVAAPGYRTGTATVSVREGAESTVSIKLEIDPSAVAAAPAAAPAGPGEPVAPVLSATAATSAPASSGPSRGLAYVALGVGGVGLAVGTIFGVLALGTKSTLDDHCVNKLCPSSSQSDIDALSTKSTVSTIAFAVGIVGVAAGTVLLVLSHKSDAPSAAAREPERPRITPWLGVGTAGVGGTFQ